MAAILPSEVLPDPQRVLAGWLRSQPELRDLIGYRVYTVFPRKPGGDTFVLLDLIGGEPVVQRPNVYYLGRVQANVYGGRHSQIWDVVQTILWLAWKRGTGTDGNPTVRVGAIRDLPDETYDSPRPRYVVDLEVFVRPGTIDSVPVPPSEEVASHARS